MNEIREKLAALEHEQWAHWTAYMLEKLFPQLFDGSQAVYPSEDVKRWMVQIKTPYAELSEKEKDSDRVWADKVLGLFTVGHTSFTVTLEKGSPCLCGADLPWHLGLRDLSFNHECVCGRTWLQHKGSLVSGTL